MLLSYFLSWGIFRIINAYFADSTAVDSTVVSKTVVDSTVEDKNAISRKEMKNESSKIWSTSNDAEGKVRRAWCL